MDTKVQPSTFGSDTLKGLSSNPKFLLSKYFYDSKGSKIFKDIMRMPEYYLTDCELEIFQTHKAKIASALGNPKKGFELIELGAGDGMKTKILLAYLVSQKSMFKYLPIDISSKAIGDLQRDLQKNFPALIFEGKIGDYFKLITKLNSSSHKVVLFLGSNIGNFNEVESVHFLTHLKEVLNPGDQLLIGFDLRKDPEIILKAYNDPHGLTEKFNLNLLQRINEELDGDFDPANFFHHEEYDRGSGTAKSYLVSKITHNVQVRKLEKTFRFEENEKIFMEMSQKFDLNMIGDLAQKSGFIVTDNFYDSRKWFVDSLWRVKD